MRLAIFVQHLSIVGRFKKGKTKLGPRAYRINRWEDYATMREEQEKQAKKGAVESLNRSYKFL